MQPATILPCGVFRTDINRWDRGTVDSPAPKTTSARRLKVQWSRERIDLLLHDAVILDNGVCCPASSFTVEGRKMAQRKP